MTVDWNGRLKDQQDWSKAVVFEQGGKVLGSKGGDTDTKELELMTSAWENRDDTVGKGLFLGGKHFEVHRWYETLVYGRRGDVENGEGICLIRVSWKL